MKNILFLVVFLIFTKSFAQNINEYQYVVVPLKFQFLKDNDKYELNTLTKMALEKYGFKTFFGNENIPAEFSNKRCEILFADLIEDSGLFQTKVKIVLKDCNEKAVYETAFGSSRDKQFTVAYKQALREAVKSFDKLNYKYSGKTENNSNEVTTPQETDVVIVDNPNALTSNNPDIFYFAQPISNGFQIVNSEPRVIMRLLNTSQKNVFIGVRGDEKGVVITKEGKWFFEYYDGKLISEPLNLKF